MSSGTTAKVRLVRCPRCRQILLELPDVPVYECGECGTLLQAKYKKDNGNSTPPGSHEKDTAQTENSATIAQYSSHEASPHTEGEHSLHQNNERNQSVPEDCGEKVNGVNLPNGDRKDDGDQHESGSSSGEQHGRVALSNADETSGSSGNECGACSDEQVGPINLPDEYSCDQSASSDCDVEQSRVSNEMGKQNKSEDCKHELVEVANTSFVDQNRGNYRSEFLDGSRILNQNESHDGCDEQVGGIDSDDEQIHCANLSSGYQSNASDKDEHSESNIEPLGDSNEVCSSSNLAILQNEILPPSEGAYSEGVVNDVMFSLPGEKAVDINKNSDSDSRRSSTDKLCDERQSSSTVTVHNPAMGNLESYPAEQLEQPQGNVHRGLGLRRSTDTFDSVDFVDPSSELSETLIDLSKSPTTTSARAYYDGWVSTDDPSDRHKRSSRYVHRPANAVTSDERYRREKLLGNNGSHHMHHQLKNSRPVMPDKIFHAKKSSELDQGWLPKPTRLGHQVQNWRGFEQDDYPYELPFHQSGILPGHGSGNPDQVQNDFHINSSFQSHDNPADTELEKLKLLRMIYELQDEINKTRIRNEHANGRVSPAVWKEHHYPTYNVHDSQEKEFFGHVNYPLYAGRFREVNNWPHQTRQSRIPYSAEATINRHQSDHLLCSCPHEWQYSTQPPAVGPHHSQGFCKVHSRLYNSYGSCPSSPQRHLDSEFSMYRHRTKSDDQRHRDHEVKYLRDKHHPAKRHLRPLAGGAPFLACSSCLTELQLPADFLLFKRRCHSLRCGACSAVLKFSLLNGTHLLPYTPTVKAPPPSEIDEFSEAVHQRNLSSASHVDPVSFSEDYGRSYSKSYSTDEDPIYQKSSHAVQSNAVERNYVSPEEREDRKKVSLSVGKNKVKTPVKTFKSSDPSSSMTQSKESSEVDEPAAGGGGGSPLHRLMGYSSLSQVFNGRGPSVAQASSYDLEKD
ncbi:hypothetical protein Tsubulata_017041 [Turnera subulata]|uniref:Zinc-ribbon domain-containing protein n=1 Tax=Turnera subulata TaxID=218843 RepID=A0A9Q0J114_9ROSI|nr:hypothetical protein Tsubulata_017041 [Turnera subulata]